MALRPPFLSFYGETCAILQALRWPLPLQQVCHFSFRLLLCPLHTVLFSDFYLKHSGTSGRNCLFSPAVPSSYNGSPGHLFTPRNDVADKLTRRGELLPSAVHCSPSSFFFIFIFVFFRTESVPSYLSPLPHRFPWCLLKS